MESTKMPLSKHNVLLAAGLPPPLRGDVMPNAMWWSFAVILLRQDSIQRGNIRSHVVPLAAFTCGFGLCGAGPGRWN